MNAPVSNYHVLHQARPAGALGLVGRLLWTFALIAAAVLLCLFLYLAWRFLPLTPHPGFLVLVVAISVAGAAVVCLAGAMFLLDRHLSADPPPRWYVRWPLELYQRVLLLAQLAAAALILWFGGILIFGFAVPKPK